MNAPAAGGLYSQSTRQCDPTVNCSVARFPAPCQSCVATQVLPGMVGAGSDERTRAAGDAGAAAAAVWVVSATCAVPTRPKPAALRLTTLINTTRPTATNARRR